MMEEAWDAMRADDSSDGVLRFPLGVIDVAKPLVERAERFLVRNPGAEDALRRLFTLRLAHVPKEGEAVRRRARKSDCRDDEWALVRGAFIGGVPSALDRRRGRRADRRGRPRGAAPEMAEADGLARRGARLPDLEGPAGGRAGGVGEGSGRQEGRRPADGAGSGEGQGLAWQAGRRSDLQPMRRSSMTSVAAENERREATDGELPERVVEGWRASRVRSRYVAPSRHVAGWQWSEAKHGQRQSSVAHRRLERRALRPRATQSSARRRAGAALTSRERQMRSAGDADAVRSQAQPASDVDGDGSSDAALAPLGRGARFPRGIERERWSARSTGRRTASAAPRRWRPRRPRPRAVLRGHEDAGEQRGVLARRRAGAHRLGGRHGAALGRGDRGGDSRAARA